MDLDNFYIRRVNHQEMLLLTLKTATGIWIDDWVAGSTAHQWVGLLGHD